uniref:Uncharacterized protein n=1 Tax=Ditylenchus dipsaci TaxID=166011 RepID=A0A915E353_9BILA
MCLPEHKHHEYNYINRKPPSHLDFDGHSSTLSKSTPSIDGGPFWAASSTIRTNLLMLVILVGTGGALVVVAIVSNAAGVHAIAAVG